MESGGRGDGLKGRGEESESQGDDVRYCCVRFS